MFVRFAMGDNKKKFNGFLNVLLIN